MTNGEITLSHTNMENWSILFFTPKPLKGIKTAGTPTQKFNGAHVPKNIVLVMLSPDPYEK